MSELLNYILAHEDAFRKYNTTSVIRLPYMEQSIADLVELEKLQEPPTLPLL